MDTETNYTSPTEDNLLNLSNKTEINTYEAKGIAKVELFIIGLDTAVEISLPLILQIHKVAFGELYDWAGKWRNTIVNVGSYLPPEPQHIPALMSQYIDEVRYRRGVATDNDNVISLLCYAHHRFVSIHPFNNGNGRTARLIANLVCLLHGYKPMELYHREGEDRKTYIEAIQEGDKGDFTKLRRMIESELIPL